MTQPALTTPAAECLLVLVPMPLAEHGGPLAFLTPRQVARFWSKVDRSGGPGACWPWTRAIDADGYGKFQITTGWRPGSGRPPQIHVRAPRVALALATGRWSTLYVLHSCPGGDLRACCNARHLREGTQRENISDMNARGRHGRGFSAPGRRGERHPNASMTEAQAREAKARLAAGERPCVVARALGASYQAIGGLKSGRTWGWL